MLKAYLAWGEAVSGLVDKTSLSDVDKARAHLITEILIDAVAPVRSVRQVELPGQGFPHERRIAFPAGKECRVVGDECPIVVFALDEFLGKRHGPSL